MGRAHGTFGGGEKCTQGFGGKHERERDNLEHIGLYERMILKMDLQAEG